MVALYRTIGGLAQSVGNRLHDDHISGAGNKEQTLRIAVMTEVPDYLREQFDRVNLKLDRLSADVGEVRQRLTTLEIQVGGQAATEQSHYGQTMLRLDRFGERLDRIERRLDLADEPAA
jgi:hypothetical protein